MAPTGPVRLSGVDVFHVRVHQEMRRRGLAGNSCALALELADHVDEQLLSRRLRAACAELPELRWRLGRDSRWQPVWRLGAPEGGPRLAVRALAPEQSLLDATTALLDEAADGRRPFGLVLLRGPQADAVVLRWFHPAADARGAARLLGWLGEGTGPALPPTPAAQDRFASVDSRVDGLESRQRWQLLGAYREHVLAIASRPIVSLDTASGRGRPGRTRALRVRLDRERSERFARLAQQRAGLAETSLLVFAGARLADRALRARGHDPERHTLVVPLSLDPKQGCQRMFGNHLTMMMMTVDREQLGERRAVVSSLAQQRRTILRERLDVAMLAALDVARYLPGPLYSWFSRRPFRSERMSMLVTDPGQVCIQRFLGVPVNDAVLVPTAVLPPGLQLVASRHDGRLSLMLVFVDSIIGPDEVRALLAGLQRDLLEDG